MTLDVALRTLNGDRVATPTRAQNVSFSFNRRGPATLSAFWPCELRQAFDLRNATNKSEIIVTDGALVVWRGTIEDRNVNNDGFSAVAYGRQMILDMPLYSALWSSSTSAEWRETTLTDAPAVGSLAPDMFNMDNNNRLYISAKKGAAYANGDRAELNYAIPHGSSRNIVEFSATYEFLFPADWELRLTSMDNDFTNRATVTTVVATGSKLTGTLSGTLSTTRARISVGVINATGGSSSPAGEDGDNYVILTSLRVSSATPPIYSSTIATALAAFAAGVNDGFISSSDVTATTTDLLGEIYEDARPASILDYLATRENYEWGVNNQNTFYFRPRGAVGVTWAIDASTIQLQESTGKLGNVVYAKYRNENGITQRTALAEDTESTSIYGLKRYLVVNTQTTSATEAGTWRDAALTNAKSYVLRASVSFDRVFDRLGYETPLYYLRPGDTLRIRNLPTTLAPDLDFLREFIIDVVEYDVATNSISVEPDIPIPTLVTLLAAR